MFIILEFFDEVQIVESRSPDEYAVPAAISKLLNLSNKVLKSQMPLGELIMIKQMSTIEYDKLMDINNL